MSCADSEVTSTLSSHRNDHESSHNQVNAETRDSSGPCIDFQPDERWHIEEDDDESKPQQTKFQENSKMDKNESNKTCKCFLIEPNCKCKINDCISEDLNSKCAFGNGKVPVLLQDVSEESMKFNGDVDKQFETNISTSEGKKMLSDNTQPSVITVNVKSSITVENEKMPSEIEKPSCQNSITISEINDTKCKTVENDLKLNKKSKSREKQTSDNAEKQSEMNEKSTKTDSKSEVESENEEFPSHSLAPSISDNSNQSENISDSGKDPLNEESSSNLSAINSHEESTNVMSVENALPNVLSEDFKSEKRTFDSNNNNKHFRESDKLENEALDTNTSCDKENESPKMEISDDLKNETKLPDGFDKYIKVGKYVPVKIPKKDFSLGENEAVLECPSLVTPLLLLKEPPQFNLPKGKGNSSHTSKQIFHAKDYFNSTTGKLLMSLGLSRVKEWYHKDMIRLKERQMKRDGKSKILKDNQERHEEAYLAAKRANRPFSFPVMRCELCPFNTDSEIVLEGHNLMPHITSRREFRCSYCAFLTRDAKSIMFHYEAIHNKQAVLEPPAQFYECPFCSFESNLKTKANSHVNRCQKNFIYIRNQAPADFDFPGLTAKLVNMTDIKNYELQLTSSKSNTWTDKGQKGLYSRNLQGTSVKGSRQLMPANNMSSGIPLYQQLASSTLSDTANSNAAIHKQNQQIVPGIHLPSGLVITRPKTPSSNRLGRPPQSSISVSVPSRQIYQVVNASGQVVPYLDKKSLNSQLPGWLTSVGTTVTPTNSGSQAVALFHNIASGGTENSSIPAGPKAVVSVHQISLGGSQLLRLQGPYPPQGAKANTPLSNILAGSRFVICEICDGYIKDLDQLRIHMQLIHKVKIHPKMLASRPPLNCQKCQWRFFTDQGLERHLLGAHGLVTSNMQDMANKSQDSGRCTICGGVYACKLVAHMSQVHKVILKPAHLSYKCTVCTATFNLYKLFENHVYTAHSGAMKRSMDDTSRRPQKKPAVSQVARKGMSQVTKVASTEPSSDEDASSEEQTKQCTECGIETGNLLSHLSEKHIKKCFVKLCRIEKCEKCLCSFDGLVVLHTSDFGLDEDDDDLDED
ncbi:MOG interacting and ectopic P-granules protein 1-like [Centruroides vittatus]|uniref:MOG interacting and ectopic P-granules protein 1-like n=1 Tax=Centruroides vittatus TaxID=120091 RepID=UPI00350FA828